MWIDEQHRRAEKAEGGADRALCFESGTGSGRLQDVAGRATVPDEIALNKHAKVQYAKMTCVKQNVRRE